MNELEQIKYLKLGKKKVISKIVDGFVCTTLHTGVMIQSFSIGDERESVLFGVFGTVIGAVGTISSLCFMGESCDRYDQYSRGLKRLANKQKPVQKCKK